MASDRVAVGAPGGRVLARFPAVPVLAAGVLLVVVLARFWVAERTATPWIMIDEILYSELAKSFAADGEFLIRDRPADIPSLLYPVAISPAWLADSIPTAYGIAKAINVILMTSAVVPVYLWARRLVTPRWALVAVGLVLVMPSMLYTGVLMSENAFLPAFLATGYALALALERPTLRRQALVFAFVALAVGVRLQALVLLAIVPAAIALKLLLDLRAPGSRRADALRELRAFWPTFAVLVGGVVAFLAFEQARGRSLSSALGSYRSVATSDYSFDTVSHWLVLHAAELAFSVGIVPACAFLVLLGLALAGRTPTTAAERAFLAVTTAAVVLVTIQVAAFASRFSLRIEERYLFPLAPLLFIALVVWIARGLPRPWALGIAAAVIPVVLLLDVRLEDLLGVQILSDTFGLIPVWRAAQLLDGGTDTAQALLWLGAVAAAAAFLFLPRRLAPLIPLGIAAFLLLGSYPVYGAVRDYSKSLEAYAGGSDLDWIDARIGTGARAPYLFDSSKVPGYDDMILWQTEFWNRSLDAAIALGPPVRDPIAEESGSVDPATGRIEAPSAAGAKYAVASPGLTLAGEVLASRSLLTLYRVDPPLRVASAVEGVYGDGWMGEHAAFNAYAKRHAPRVKVSLSRAAWGGKDVPGRVTVRIGPAAVANGAASIGRVTAQQHLTLHRLQTKTVTLPAPRGPYRVEVDVAPTFSPSSFGLPDTRQLGAQVTFSPE
ncbi:MAG: glycosyltransferase family 39 protein [Gaiellaceae bacterium]